MRKTPRKAIQLGSRIWLIPPSTPSSVPVVEALSGLAR